MMDMLGLWPCLPGVAGILGVVFIARRMNVLANAQHQALADLRSEQELQMQQRDADYAALVLRVDDLQNARSQQDNVLNRNTSVRSLRQEAMSQLRSGLQADAVSGRLELPRSEVRLLAKVQGILSSSALLR